MEGGIRCILHTNRTQLWKRHTASTLNPKQLAHSQKLSPQHGRVFVATEWHCRPFIWAPCHGHTTGHE
eukprot:364989-Chlamydomonas_euryale.AAC.5